MSFSVFSDIPFASIRFLKLTIPLDLSSPIRLAGELTLGDSWKGCFCLEYNISYAHFQGSQGCDGHVGVMRIAMTLSTWTFLKTFPIRERKWMKSIGKHMKMMNWWWWIAFVIWLTDERCLVLFPVGTIVRDPHHRESPTRLEQDLNLQRTWVQF